jgi:secreted trypsin-like serine protease
MRGSWSFAAVLIAGSSVAGAAPIIGGDPDAASSYPSVGVLTAASRLRCTATLIAPDVVLTAGHCLEQPGFGYLGFTMDADLTDGAQDIIKVAITHRHPEFDEGGEELYDLAVRNDIGIAILEQPVEGVPIEPLELAAEVTEGIELSMCGYGRSIWDRIMAGVKRGAVVVVDRMAEYELATVSDGPQPCSGDSGGPLYVETPDARVMTGIVSRAVGPSRMCNTGAIVTRIAPYTAWIAEASQDRDTGGCSSGGAGSIAAALGILGLRRRRVAPRASRR